MDELGDYLYLIFIGLAIVSSLFGRKKKKDAQKSAENPAPSTHWQEILKEMTQEKEPVREYESLPVEVLQPRQNMADQRPVVEMVNGTNFESEGVRSIVHKERDQAVIEDAQPLITVDFDDKEDLRRAIIYSEILSRKY